MKIVKPSIDEIVFHIPEGYSIETWLEKCGRTCCHPDTEVLTDSGWKLMPTVTTEDKVLTFNQHEHSLEYQPSNMVCKDFDGFLLSSQHRNVNFRITPDHRMVACKAHHRDIFKPYKFIEAQELLKRENNNGWRVPKFFGMPKTSKNTIFKDRYPIEPTSIKTRDYTYESGKPRHSTTISGKEYQIDSYLLTILAAYIAEGYIGKPKGSGSYIGITQSTSEKLYSIIEEALYELGMNFSVIPDPRKPYIHTFRIREGRPFVEWVEKHCGRYSKNKIIPEFVRMLPNHMIEHFLEVLYMGDGSGNTTRTERYLSINKTLVDQVQELWILTGKNASVGFMNSEDWKNCDGIFYAEESQRDSWIIKPDHITKEEYKGKVYCPSTKNGIICIRNNGKAMWIGNCYKSENKITKTSAPKLIRMLYKRGHHAMLEHAMASVRIIADRGLTHEIVRHRIASFAQESTRYCNYSKGKFHGEITVIEQPGLNVEQSIIWSNGMRQAEKYYMLLLDAGVKPEIARSVLPIGLKSEIVISANLREWMHVFNMRCDTPAHPIIRKCSLEILKAFNNKLPSLYEGHAERFFK